jgi:D-amino-acid dehydrogenase
MYSRARKPQTAVVVGAGMVGLSTAWHLQEHGIEVTVVDRSGVAAGASWGNAGWLTPGMAMPLADPTLWSYAPKALLDATAPLHIPARLDVRLWMFLARFGLHATSRAWKRTMDALTPIDRIALDAFDELTSNGVDSWTRSGPFIVGFENEQESKPFIHEIQQVERAGQSVPLRPLENPRLKVPQLSAGVSTVLEMEGQRFIEPGPFVEALADAVRARGASIISGGQLRARPTVRRRRGPGHRRVAAEAGQAARGADADPGRPRVLVQRRDRGAGRVPDLLPGPPRRVHPVPGAAADRRHHGVPRAG